jgi:hypothetical protein
MIYRLVYNTRVTIKSIRCTEEINNNNKVAVDSFGRRMPLALRQPRCSRARECCIKLAKHNSLSKTTTLPAPYTQHSPLILPSPHVATSSVCASRLYRLFLLVCKLVVAVNVRRLKRVTRVLVLPAPTQTIRSLQLSSMAAAHTLNLHDAISMTSRRAPLATVPNAVNSPFRGSQPLAGKRTRAPLGENVYGQPPAKKQLLETNAADGENVDPLRRTAPTVISHDKLDEPFSTKRVSTAPPTAFEKKLASVREKKPAPQSQLQQTRVDRPQVVKGDNLENVRQWQRHYRRQFPQFVFYFDNVPDEVRLKAIRQVRSLGAVCTC